MASFSALDHGQALRWVALLSVAAVLSAACNRSKPSHIATSGSSVQTAAVSHRLCPLVDRANALGVRFAYRNGAEAELSTILESLGGGVGWLDYDRDGWLDLVATGGGTLSADKRIFGL